MRLEVAGLTKAFGPHRVLEGVRLTVEGDRCVALVGPSGGGKTTLLRILAGLEHPDAGRISLNGEELVYREDWLLGYRRRVGTVFQAFNLFPHLTALENIVLPLVRVHGRAPAAARAEADALLRRLRLGGHGHKRPAALSGGQRQRVAIARALAVQPRVIFLDEPTSALDPEMTGEVLDVIAELKAEGRDLVLVTHEIAFARRIADVVAVLADGHVVESGPAAKVLAEPETEVTRAFLRRVLHE